MPNETNPKLDQMNRAWGLGEIAVLLDVSPSLLRYVLYVVEEDKRYRGFYINKKSGEKRQILAPVGALKFVQTRISDLLYDVSFVKPSAHGFVRNRSILTNAIPHVRRRWVLNVDLQDYFPSIHIGRVRGLLMSKPYSMPKSGATVLAQLCCHRGTLPQGAPTSPVISNMISTRLDRELQSLAKAHGCYYTRYADDLTFSCGSSEFPKSIAFPSDDGVQISNDLRTILQNNGFVLNETKIRLQPRHLHQEVTGITVNRKPNVSRHYVRQVRAMLHAWEKFGLQNAEAEFLAVYNRKPRPNSEPGFLFKRVVEGKIRFLGMVKGDDDQVYRAFRKKLLQLAPEFRRSDDEPLSQPVNDQYAALLSGVQKILEVIDRRSTKYRDLELLQFRLKENVTDARLNGRNENGTSERNRIVASVIALCQEVGLPKSFDEYCSEP